MQEAASFGRLLPFKLWWGRITEFINVQYSRNSPWTSVDLQDRSGKYYGINQPSNIITIDRSPLLNTPSGFDLGTSGAVGWQPVTKLSRLQNHESRNTEIIIVIQTEYSIIDELLAGRNDWYCARLLPIVLDLGSSVIKRENRLRTELRPPISHLKQPSFWKQWVLSWANNQKKRSAEFGTLIGVEGFPYFSWDQYSYRDLISLPIMPS